VNRKLLFGAFLTLLSAGISAQHPSIGGYNVYYGHLHNHSNVSGAVGTPATAYNYAKNTAHLDFLGLADHSSQISSAEWTDVKNQANSFNEDGIFATFYGFEWSSGGNYGHVAVVNTDDYCSTTSPTNTFAGLVNWLASRPDGIAFCNHPGREDDLKREFSHFTTTPSDQVVGMELWNKSTGFSTYYYNDGYTTGDNNKNYYEEANSKGWKIGASGSGDDHSGTWGTAQPYRLAILADTLTRASLLAAMQARRFFSTLDKNLSLSFKINGMEMGSTLIGSNYTAKIQAADTDGEIFNQVILYDQNHNSVNTWTLNTNIVDVSIDLNTVDGDFYYVKVRQNDGNEAISSPIWISGGAVNQYPSCSITSPGNASTFPAFDNITIDADATDADGYISKVEFYQGTSKLGEDLTSPYSFVWNNVPAGEFSLSIKAIDNKYATTTSAAVSLIVTPRPITVTANVMTKVYGDADPALTYQITSGALAGSDSFSGTLTRDAGENIGTYFISQGTLALNSNYTLTYEGTNLTITAKPITVTADMIKRIYGGTDSELTYRITSGGGLVGADAFSGALTRDAGEDVGTYQIRQGTLTLTSNYTLTYAGNDFTILARPITVTARKKTKVYGEDDPPLTYQITSGALIGTDSFSGALKREPGEGVGTYIITRGNLALSGNYKLTFVAAFFTITAHFEIKAYPNPFTDNIFFEMDFNNNANISLDIYNLRGSKIATVFSGNVEPDFYRFIYVPEHKVSGSLIYRLTVEGRKRATGKIIRTK